MSNDRQKVIVRTSLIGILANVLLAGFKAVVGLVANSVAVIMDAVNNLSDAVSSVITIIGAKISARDPDKKHPLGHGRVEYLSAMIIAVIILYAGITALIESVKKIITPEAAEYSTVSLIIIGAAVLVKILLGTFVKKKGQEVSSDALVASGSDALFDAVISASTLVAAAIYLIWGISLEAYLAAVISLLIIKSGFEMLRDTVSEILGERPDPELTAAVKTAILGFPEVHGAYDLFLHNYGPDKIIGSVHIAVFDHLTAVELDALERKIAEKVFIETGVAMAGISVYSINDANAEAADTEKKVRSIVGRHPEVIEMHGFFRDPVDGSLRLDIIVSFDCKDRPGMVEIIRKELKEAFPGTEVYITLDLDVSD